MSTRSKSRSRPLNTGRYTNDIIFLRFRTDRKNDTQYIESYREKFSQMDLNGDGTVVSK